jgi:hypothetical protein
MSARKTQDQFLSDCHKIHGDKYDYSKTKYDGAHKKVIITCPIHGDFTMTPNNHSTKKQGCPFCANQRKGAYRKSNTDKYVKKLKEIFGTKYDFSKFEYVNNRVKSCVICPEHGEFWARPIDLLHGHGCPSCARKFKISENSVFEAVKEHFPNLTVESNKPLPFLKSKTSYQTIDIFIKEYNIGIEYQGAQHFEEKVRFGGKENYIKTIERDKRKYDKCVENGVKMFYISFEKNIPSDYFLPVYKNINDLLSAIDEYINSKQDTLPLNESDIKAIVKNILTELWHY